MIGAGAKILPGVIIGNNIKIGANAVVNKMLREESEKWRASHNALIVTTRQSLLASGSEVDITADVLSAMNARSPKFADLPQIEVNPREKVEDNNKKAKK